MNFFKPHLSAPKQTLLVFGVGLAVFGLVMLTAGHKTFVGIWALSVSFAILGTLLAVHMDEMKKPAPKPQSDEASELTLAAEFIFAPA